MTARKTPASTGDDRLGIYLAHFADHLEDHLEDLTQHRVRETESAELTRLLDEASASIEASRQAIGRVLAHLGVETGAGHDHDHGHDHGSHHHHHGDGTHARD